MYRRSALLSLIGALGLAWYVVVCTIRGDIVSGGYQLMCGMYSIIQVWKVWKISGSYRCMYSSSFHFDSGDILYILVLSISLSSGVKKEKYNLR